LCQAALRGVAWRAPGAGDFARLPRDREASESIRRFETSEGGKEIDASERTIERLKLVLGAARWKAFMAEVAAAHGRGRDVVVWRWLAVAETMRAEKLAEQRAEAKADAEIEKRRHKSGT